MHHASITKALSITLLLSYTIHTCAMEELPSIPGRKTGAAFRIAALDRNRSRMESAVQSGDESYGRSWRRLAPELVEARSLAERSERLLSEIIESTLHDDIAPLTSIDELKYALAAKSSLERALERTNAIVQRLQPIRNSNAPAHEAPQTSAAQNSEARQETLPTQVAQKCGICYTKQKEQNNAPCCNQTVCQACWKQWFELSNGTCPFCRQTQVPAQITPNPAGINWHLVLRLHENSEQRNAKL